MHQPPEPSAALDFTEVMYPKGIMMDDIVYGASLSPVNGLGAYAISGAAPGLLWSLDLGLNVGSIYAMAQEGTLVAALTGNGRHGDRHGLPDRGHPEGVVGAVSFQSSTQLQGPEFPG